jgi:hypothetical protein
MNKEIWIQFICATIEELLENETRVTCDSVIFGSCGVLSSLQLVELMLALEDKCTELGVLFEWTNDAAFSERRGLYRNPVVLAEFLAALPMEKNHG